MPPLSPPDLPPGFPPVDPANGDWQHPSTFFIGAVAAHAPREDDPHMPFSYPLATEAHNSSLGPQTVHEVVPYWITGVPNAARQITTRRLKRRLPYKYRTLVHTDMAKGVTEDQIVTLSMLEERAAEAPYQMPDHRTRDETVTAILAYLRDGSPPLSTTDGAKLFPLPQLNQSLANMWYKIPVVRPSPDQRHQVHQVEGVVAAVGFHSENNTDIISAFDNLGKRGQVKEIHVAYVTCVHRQQVVEKRHHNLAIAFILHCAHQISRESQSPRFRNKMSEPHKLAHINERQQFAALCHNGDLAWMNHHLASNPNAPSLAAVMALDQANPTEALSSFVTMVPGNDLVGYLSKTRHSLTVSHEYINERLAILKSKLPDFVSGCYIPLFRSQAGRDPELTPDRVPCAMFPFINGRWVQAGPPQCSRSQQWEGDVLYGYDVDAPTEPDEYWEGEWVPQDDIYPKQFVDSPGDAILLLCILLLLKIRRICDRRFPANPVITELHILLFLGMVTATDGLVDPISGQVIIIDPATGLPAILNGWTHYPLAATSIAHGNHSLPFHFGGVVQWPSIPDHFVAELVNAAYQGWPFNAQIASHRYPGIVDGLEGMRPDCQQVLDGLTAAGLLQGPPMVLQTFDFTEGNRALLLRNDCSRYELATVWPHAPNVLQGWGMSWFDQQKLNAATRDRGVIDSGEEDALDFSDLDFSDLDFVDLDFADDGGSEGVATDESEAEFTD